MDYVLIALIIAAGAYFAGYKHGEAATKAAFKIRMSELRSHVDKAN